MWTGPDQDKTSVKVQRVSGQSESKEAMMMIRAAKEDIRSSTGSNIRLIEEEAGLDPCTVGKKELREALRRRGTVDVPNMDFWRPTYLRKLLSKRREMYYQADTDSQKELQSLIDSLCIN